MTDRYILNGHEPIPEPDLFVWAKWFGTDDNRIVARTRISDTVKVSTVFLGLDHAFGAGNVPILFETMIFGGPHDQYQDRYATWDEAEAGHAKAVTIATEGKGQS